MSFSYNPNALGTAVRLSTEQTVSTVSDLAVTPSMMAEMVDRGIPVSSQQISGIFYDGVENPTWDVPIDMRRGVDVAAVWDAQKSSRENIRSHIVTKNTVNNE